MFVDPSRFIFVLNVCCILARFCSIYNSLSSSVKGALSRLRQFLATESPLKMVKNAFYFTLKTFLPSRYLNFCLDFLVIYKSSLIGNIIAQ